MKIGEIVPEREVVQAEKRYVISVSALSHQWLKAEAERRNVTLQQVTEESFYAYRNMVEESIAIKGEE